MMARDNTPETRPSLILRLRDPEDMLAWQEFVEIYQPLIRALAQRHGLQDADSDDVTQEVLVRVARNIDQWKLDSRQKSSFRAWLATITRNQTIQVFRQSRRRPKTGADSQISRMPIELEEDAFNVEQDRRLFAWAARRVQTRFETTTWQAFWLTAIEGVSVAEAASRLEVSLAKIYVARSRVMSAMKNIVEKSGFESSADWSMS